MKAVEQEPSHFNLGLNDILYILFEHKWKILLCALAGLAAAVGVYFLHPPSYESRAKLLVRYVLERSAIDAVEPQVKTSGPQSDAIINSEVEILTSLDLAVQVVETVGVKRLLPPSQSESGKSEAVRTILDGLKVEARKGNNVIIAAYRNRDPELARAVLDELVKLYFVKHLEVHRSLGAFEFVSQQTDQVRSRLRATEGELDKLKATAGITSLAETTTSLNGLMNKSQEELLVAEAELAQQQARLKEMERLLKGGPPEATVDKTEAPTAVTTPAQGNGPPPSSASVDKVETPRAPADSATAQRYKVLVDRVAELRKSELELLAKYTPESQPVKSVRSEVKDLDRQRADLEKAFPALLATVPTSSSTRSAQPDILTESASLAATAAKVETLKAQLRAIKEQSARLAQLAPQIIELERKREAEETNFKYFESSLEKARIDEALDGKTPNISIVQQPTIGVRVTGEAKKLMMGLVGGGVALGAGLAFLIELLLNRSVRRPLELETRLRIPQIASIPYFPGGARPRLRLSKGTRDKANDPDNALAKTARPDIAPWDSNHFIRAASEEIRDRLILSFQLKNLTHKPKLVGIAGLSGGEGATTLAGGLAAALSETGEGKVLLVDMNARGSEAHPFSDGKPACGLAEALGANGRLPPAADNLYLATGSSANGGLMQLAAKRFYALVPDLKASHFDYIIFDLPPVNQGSATLAIAGCLDKFLLLVEAGKTARDEVKRAHAELVAARADVAGVLNKTRDSGPKWLNT